MSEPNLASSSEELFAYAMEGDRANANRSNFQHALAILQFQVLVQQKRTAEAQRVAALATVLLFIATIALVVVTSV
jgi:hypothetical protein